MNDGRTGPDREALPLEDVGRLVELLAESGVGEIRVRQGELEITVKARSEAAAGAASAPQPELQAAPRVEVTPVPEPEHPVGHPAERNGGLHVVRSPVVGTFYRAPTPGGEPYAQVGDHVGAGQPLCIVEAMKLMNEIPADVSGEVVEILVENGKGVEYDQPLFHIRPAASS
jgi:acetyl-CoA carboxylase biotin carboxyl carrier protein